MAVYQLCTLVDNVYDNPLLHHFRTFVAMFIVKFFVEFLPQARIAKILFISIGIVVFYSLVMTPFFSDTWEQRKDDYQLKQNLLYDLTKKKPTQGEYKSLSSYKRFVDIEDINIPDNTLIKLYNLPSSFVLPFGVKTKTFVAFWSSSRLIHGIKTRIYSQCRLGRT